MLSTLQIIVIMLRTCLENGMAALLGALLWSVYQALLFD
jgi:hypothetical protein